MASTLAETSGNLETVKVGRTNRLGINLVISHGRVKKGIGTSRYQLGSSQGRERQTDLDLTCRQSR